MNYGIELEFFVKDNNGLIVPAYKATRNVDGNPVIGEVRTKVHDSILDAIFELKKLLFLETTALLKQGFILCLEPKVIVENDFLQTLRKDRNYISTKTLEVLEEKSIYGRGVGRILPRGTYKASLQVNLSDNKSFSYPKFEKIEVDDKYKFVKKSDQKVHSEVFDFVSVIRELDLKFKDQIRETGRVAGVYTIKPGELGRRVEYRSLPNNIDLDILLETLNK